MKIHTFGARQISAQVARIDQGFKQLGHEIVRNLDEADLVYCNNAFYDDIISAKKFGEIHGKIIFNVLDCAAHLGDAFPLDKLRDQLIHADAITTISEYVQSDLKERAGFDSTVIYQPIKPVTKTGKRVYPYRAMFVGRVNDPNKRAVIGAEALRLLGFEDLDFVTVGGEEPRYGGVWAGIVDDKMLNDLYNSVDFVVFPSFSEGIGLPIFEAMAAGAIPVICNDLTTREEFLPSTTFPEYSEVEATPQSLAKFMDRYLKDESEMAEFKNRLNQHFAQNLAEKFGGVGVAKKILEVYEGLK